MKQAIIELEALQNAATDIGLTIHEKFTTDKRQTLKRYFAQRGRETVSPVLDYEQLNHFLLGWNRAKAKPGITQQPRKKSNYCLTCGGHKEIHQANTMICPKYGREETREGVPQVWGETKFDDGAKMNVTIYFAGDPSVGISSYAYSMEIPNFEEEWREDTRKRIQDLYTELDGEFYPTVFFGDENID